MLKDFKFLSYNSRKKCVLERLDGSWRFLKKEIIEIFDFYVFMFFYSSLA